MAPKPLHGEIRILIVEDNLEILEMLSSHLGKYFLIETSTSGKEGLQLAKKNCPHLALLDINIPGIDGFSLCKILKEDPETKTAKVILLTASYTDEDGKMMGKSAGCDAYLIKPVRSKILLEKVHEILGIPFSAFN